MRTYRMASEEIEPRHADFQTGCLMLEVVDLSAFPSALTVVVIPVLSCAADCSMCLVNSPSSFNSFPSRHTPAQGLFMASLRP